MSDEHCEHCGNDVDTLMLCAHCGAEYCDGCITDERCAPCRRAAVARAEGDWIDECERRHDEARDDKRPHEDRSQD